MAKTITEINNRGLNSIFKLDIKRKLMQAMLRDLKKQLRNEGYAIGGRAYANCLVIPEMRMQIKRIKKTLQNLSTAQRKQIQVSDYAMKYGVR